MQLMGLDVGERRIGVALGDTGSGLATPLTVLVRNSRARDFQSIEELSVRYGVEQIVVGLPQLEDGSLGSQARRIQAFVRQLERHLDVKVAFWDERFTTAEAEGLLARRGMPWRRRRRVIDAAAAALMLQSYLDYRRYGFRELVAAPPYPD